MGYCVNCGKELENGAAFCSVCGTPVGNRTPEQNRPADEPSTGLNIVGFLFPFIGLILYLVMKKDTPVKAGSIGKFALIGFCIWVALSFINTSCNYLAFY